MNIFSNLGVTELLIILLLALIVIGPERLPEFGRRVGKTLRDLRRAYDNLTRDLGQELTSIQQSTQELRESVDAVRSIPQDMIKSVVKAADLDETVGELKQVAQDMGQVGKTLSTASQAIREPLGTAAAAARSALLPSAPSQPEVQAGEVDRPRTDSAEGPPEEQTHA